MTAIGRYQILLIDLDGTIADYARTEASALASVHAAFFSGCFSFPEFVRAFHACNDELWAAYRRHEITLDALRSRRFELLAARSGLTRPASVAGPVTERFELALGRAVVVFPDARPALSALRAVTRLVLVTDGIAAVQHAKLDTGRLRPFFEQVVISAEVGYRKPDPALLRHALRRAGASSDGALMVGDSRVSDGAAAQAAGVDFCWVDRSGCPAAAAGGTAAHGTRPAAPGYPHRWARPVLRSPRQAAAVSASALSPVPVRLRVPDLRSLTSALAGEQDGRLAGRAGRAAPGVLAAADGG